MAHRPLLSFLIAALSLGISDASLSNGDTCLQLGFSPSTLLCSSCDELSAFNLGKLQKDCKECCQDDETSQDEKFSYAILEVCGWKLGHFPEIKGFVKGDRPRQFPNLQIKYLRGAMPVLKLMNEEQEIVDTLSIASWNSDTIEEFLREKLH